MFKKVFVENSIRISVWPKNSCGFLIGNKIDDVYNVFFFVQYAGEINVENIPNLKKRTDELFRILPGSISVLGLYYVAEHSGLNYDSDKILKDYSMITNDYTKIFILVNANNYKFCARRIDLSEDKCKFEDIDIEYKDILSGYQSFQSDIIIKLDIYIHSEYDINLILKEFKDLVNPFITDYLSKSIMNVNGEELNPGAQFGEQLKSQLELTFHDEDGEELHPGAQFGEQLELQSSSIEGINLGGLMLEESSFENNNSRLELAFHDVDGEELHPGAQFGAQLKSQSELTFHDVNMDIFFNKLLKSESEKDFELVNRVQIQGRISVVAFLPTLATMQEVSNALKQDFTRSLFARLELLTEKEGEIKVSQMLLPRRVKVMLPWCPTLPLSEYKFSSETELDVISRIKDFCRPPGMSDEQLDSKCVNMGIEQLEQESDDALHIITIPNIDENIQEIRHFEKNSTKWNDNINITGDIGKYHEYFDITIDLEVDGNMEPYGPTSRPLRNLDYRSPKHISFSIFLPREKFMITGNYVGVLSDLLE